MPVVAATAQSDVLRACRAIGKAIGAISVPNAPSAQAYVGWPTSTKIVESIQQDGSPVHVTIWPHPGQKTTRYRTKTSLFQTTTPTFSVEVLQGKTSATLAFSGVVSTANVHTVINEAGDAYLLASPSQTITELAAAVAAQVNALNLPGVTAAASGTEVIIEGARITSCDIGASGLLIRETARVARQIQVTVWAPTPSDVSSNALALRDLAGQQILATLGGTDRVFLTDDLGLGVMCQYNGRDSWFDEEQLKYSIYRWDIFFDCEHAITQIVPTTPVGAAKFTLRINNNPPQTAYFGGSSTPSGDDMPAPVSNALNLSVPTIVKVGPGWVYDVDVTAAGGGPGALYDNDSTVSGNTSSTLIGYVGAEIDTYPFDGFPFTTGLVFIPSANQVASISYT